MRLLVTGGGGQLAQALAALAGSGTTVIAPPRAAFDIAAPEAAERWLAETRPDALVNAAAYTAVDRAESEPERAMEVNGEAPGRLAEAARRHGVRFVHVSTDFVFDGCQSRPYPPEAETAPLGAYGRSKRAGEVAVLAADPHALILRTAWVYAAEGRNFLRTMLRLMAERDEVRVVSDQVGTPTHAASLARAILALLATPARGILHWTDAGVASWYDFAVAISEEAASRGLLPGATPVIPIRTADYPTPARRPGWSVLDCTATHALVGLPRHWRAELRDALDSIAAGSRA